MCSDLVLGPGDAVVSTAEVVTIAVKFMFQPGGRGGQRTSTQVSAQYFIEVSGAEGDARAKKIVGGILLHRGPGKASHIR